MQSVMRIFAIMYTLSKKTKSIVQFNVHGDKPLTRESREKSKNDSIVFFRKSKRFLMINKERLLSLSGNELIGAILKVSVLN